MTLELGGDRTLVLNVEGGAWLWALAALAAVGLLAMLARDERRLAPPKVARALLGLRVAAGLALAAALLEPTLDRTRLERPRGRLILGVDHSMSMDVADDRPPEDLGRLRDAPGLAPIDPGVEPERRADVAARIVRGSAMTGLGRALDIEAFGFARSTESVALDELGRRPDDAGDPDDRRGTDWGPVLDRALIDDPSSTVIGVVLLTDGRRNAPVGSVGGDPLDRLADRGVPIFPVLVGATAPPHDLAIVSVRAPASAFEGETVPVLVELKADGVEAGAEIPVALEVPGLGTLRATARAEGDGRRPVAAFRVPLERPGRLEVSASLAMPDGRPDAMPANDRRSAAVHVVDGTVRVLLIDAEARWEFRYLRAALERDPRVDLGIVLLDPPPAADGASPTFPDTLPEAPEPGSDAGDPLGDFDAIILGDLPAERAPDDLWPRLDAYVSTRGGTLVIADGPKAHSGPRGLPGAALGLLPVDNLRPVPIDPSAIDPARASLPNGVAVAPAPGLDATPGAWPMLEFDAGPEASRAAWSRLAPLPWALAGRPKPGATALLVAEPSPASTSGSGSVDPAALPVVAAAHPFGLGRVLWVGLDGTWRWRLRVGDAYHHRFWGQVVRWAASAPSPSGNRLVRFEADRPLTPEGTPVTLRARFSADAPDLPPDLLLAARIRPAPAPANPEIGNRLPSGFGNPESAIPEFGERPNPIAIVPLRPSADRPRTFEADTPALPPGRYDAALDVPALAELFDAEGLSPALATFEVAPPETGELLELAADPAPLRRLAEATGGRLLRDFEAGLLPGLLEARASERPRTDSDPLWDTPIALLLVFTLLAAEWLLRRRAGLP